MREKDNATSKFDGMSEVDTSGEQPVVTGICMLLIFIILAPALWAFKELAITTFMRS